MLRDLLTDLRPYSTSSHSGTHCIEHQLASCAPSPGWLIDSGSTDHTSPQNSNMLNYVECDKPEHLLVAHGNKEEIVGEGTFKLNLNLVVPSCSTMSNMLPPIRSNCCPLAKPTTVFY